MEERLRFVTFCGLHCDLCSARARIPQRAAALQEAMAEEGWPLWGAEVPGFAQFWQFLEGLHADGGCPGCRAGGGPPFCAIRKCAREREVAVCVECCDFPCDRIRALEAIYPTAIADARRLKDVGLDQWLNEQAERRRRGVVYSDFRHQVDETTQSQAFGEPE
jgi:hypothetical protein